jgi:hypothetical protein
MNTLRMTFIAALLAASSAYANAATDWTAAIGTGHAADGNATAPAATGVPSSPHWSASIGTGHAADSASPSSARSSTSGSTTAAAHWTSQIGTGHATDSNVRLGSAAAAASRSRS